MFGVQSRSSDARRLPLLGPQVGDRLLQHLLVELEADFADMAGLLVAQQIAGAADVEVVAGELEAGAQRVQRSAAPSAASRPRRSAAGSAARSDRHRPRCLARPTRPRSW